MLRPALRDARAPHAQPVFLTSRGQILPPDRAGPTPFAGPGGLLLGLKVRRVYGRTMATTERAYGQFEVEITPLEPATDMDGVSTGRNQVDKQFQGDMDGTSRGEMLTAMIPATQSAAYVAIERVNCRLAG